MTEAATLMSWRAVHDSFLKYRHCDDGAIGEGYSESVTLLLADHWDTLPELGRFAGKDKDFEKFVVRHVDETVPRERLERIATNARQRCPKQLTNLCKRLDSRE